MTKKTHFSVRPKTNLSPSIIVLKNWRILIAKVCIQTHLTYLEERTKGTPKVQISYFFVWCVSQKDDQKNQLHSFIDQGHTYKKLLTDIHQTFFKKILYSRWTMSSVEYFYANLYSRFSDTGNVFCGVTFHKKVD